MLLCSLLNNIFLTEHYTLSITNNTVVMQEPTFLNWVRITIVSKARSIYLKYLPLKENTELLYLVIPKAWKLSLNTDYMLIKAWKLAP